MKELTVILLDEDGEAHGKANYDRWNKLPWYKRKFIDMRGFDIIQKHSVDHFYKELKRR